MAEDYPSNYKYVWPYLTAFGSGYFETAENLLSYNTINKSPLDTVTRIYRTLPTRHVDVVWIPPEFKNGNILTFREVLPPGLSYNDSVNVYGVRQTPELRGFDPEVNNPNTPIVYSRGETEKLVCEYMIPQLQTLTFNDRSASIVFQYPTGLVL